MEAKAGALYYVDDGHVECTGHGLMTREQWATYNSEIPTNAIAQGFLAELARIRESRALNSVGTS